MPTVDLSLIPWKAQLRGGLDIGETGQEKKGNLLTGQLIIETVTVMAFALAAAAEGELLNTFCNVAQVRRRTNWALLLL